MDLPDIHDLFGYVSLDTALQYAHINRPDFNEVYQKLHPSGYARTAPDDESGKQF